MVKDVVIIGALRTPIDYFRGALAGHSTVGLGSLVVKALIGRTGVPAYAVDEVTLGQVLTVGVGQNPARQSATKDGPPSGVSTIITNDVCGSGPRALHLATQAIQCGEADIAIAGGQENMNRAPHVLTDSRTDAQLGNSQLVDSLVHDGLWDAFNDYRTDVTAESLAYEYGISHQLQGACTFSSQQRTRAVISAGQFKGETIPVITQSNGQMLVVDTDEQPCTDTSAEVLARLNPSPDNLGSVTTGNISSINDGVATVMVMSEAKTRVLNLFVLARIRVSAGVGMDPALMGIAPVYVTRRCLERVGWQLADVDLIEASEAFAAQTLSIGKILEWDERRVNVNGDAIALGHPIGTSGYRTLVSPVHEVMKRNAHKGLATLCIDEDQGMALATERGG